MTAYLGWVCIAEGRSERDVFIGQNALDLQLGQCVQQALPEGCSGTGSLHPGLGSGHEPWMKTKMKVRQKPRLKVRDRFP